MNTCLAQLAAFAHPGHGHTDPDSWRHYIVEPVHVVGLVGAIVALFVTWLAYRRARAARTQSTRRR